MEVLNTFWDIVSNQGIEIPPIQRDYAQGRKSERIQNIRTRFMNSIFAALKSNTPLRLDFIYGKIYGIRNEEEHRRNKQAINSLLMSVKDYATSIDLTFDDFKISDKSTNIEDLVYLIPLDGQQRLTALFLLHWYLSKRLGLKESMSVLKRFKYKTRKSSLSFISLLCSDITIDFKNSLDEEIKNHEHFSNTWIDDPTVTSILEVLKTIHEIFKMESDHDIANYWHRLTIDKLIFFDFLDLKDFNLSDELYVKMNARGKQLSEFENFKAWLIGEIEKREIFESRIWEKYLSQFDIQWNDIFWDSKESGVYDIDDVYLNSFKLLFVYDLVKNVNLIGTDFEACKNLDCINSIQKNSAINFEDFGELFFENIQKYFKLLEICSGYNPKDDILYEFHQFYFSKSGTAPNWSSLIKHYMLLSYLDAKSKKLVDYTDTDRKDLNDYFRIMNNLFRNSAIDNPSLYKSAINEIDVITKFLCEADFSVIKWIDIFEYNTKSVFQKHQVDEEILKYRLLNMNHQWMSLILEAEALPYFEGQLNFWFYKCEMTLDKNKFDNIFFNETYLKQFQSLTKRIVKLFDDSGLNRQGEFTDQIFERALLSKSDYLLKEVEYKCFGRNSGRDVSWKRLFLRDRNTETTNTALKEIFDLDFDNIKVSFQKYIDNNKQEYSSEKWREEFVENKTLFDYVGRQKYIRNILNHGWVIIKDSYKTYIGPHYELFSLSFYTKYILGKIDDFRPFNDSGCYAAPKNSLDDVPCTFLSWKVDDFIFRLDIRYINEKFTLRFFSDNAEISKGVKGILIASNFNEIDGGFNIEFEDETKTLVTIKSLAKKLLSYE